MGIIDKNSIAVSFSGAGGGDEITVTATIINETADDEQYQLHLVGQSGDVLDREPDVLLPNVNPGRSVSITVTTKGHYGSVGDLGDVFELRLIENDFIGNTVINRVFINTARPTLIFDTFQDAMASVTDEDQRINRERENCDLLCQWFKANKTIVIAGGVIIGGLLAYALLTSLKRK